MKQNCINCGAVLHYENNKAICDYCKSEYLLDQLGRIEQYKVELEIFGKKHKFYISKLELKSLFKDSYIDMTTGRLIKVNKVCDKLKLELIEM